MDESRILGVFPWRQASVTGDDFFALVLARTPKLIPSRDSQNIANQWNERTKSNFAEVGFGAWIALQRIPLIRVFTVLPAVTLWFQLRISG
jgi:hypothetical protein